MPLAYTFLLAILALTVGDSDLSAIPAENIASSYAHVEQAVDSHFQLGSGAGSVFQPHGNESNEPAISVGHPHSSVSRKFRTTEVTARNLQDIQFKSISGLFSKIMSTLTNVGISPFYVSLWPIGVMLMFVYIYMLPRPGGSRSRSSCRPRLTSQV